MTEYERVASVAEFSEGRIRTFEVNGAEIAVVSYQDRFYAFSGRCTHESYSFNYSQICAGDVIMCSSHFAIFDLATGKALEGPVLDMRDLTRFGVRVEGDDVLVNPEGEA